MTASTHLLRSSLDRQIAALATGEEHAGLVELCRSLADVLDAAGEVPDDKLVREYRLALSLLSDLASGPDGDGLEESMAELRDPELEDR